MRFPNLLALAVLSLLALASCSTAPSTPAETFTLAGQKAKFSPPPSTWSKNALEIPKDYELVPVPGASPGAPATEQMKTRTLSGGDLLRFTPPWGGGHLTISAISDWAMESWDKDPERTKVHIEQLQNQVLKRRDGQILSQGEAKLGGDMAYRMEFQFVDGTKAMKGVQIHAIHKGTYWSIVLVSPTERYSEAAPVFQNVVDSFEFEG